METANNMLNCFEEKNMDYSCDEYCSNKCEFYKYCYANHECCIKQTFKDVFLHILSPREEIVIKKSYGWDGTRKQTFELIGSEFNVTSERVRQIKEKALRKLRKLYTKDVLKDFLYEAYQLKENAFYFELITDVIGKKNIPVFELNLGIDSSVVLLDKQLSKTAIEIKNELNNDITNIKELQPFITQLTESKITTLNHLLNTSNSKLLFEIFKDDVVYYDLSKTLYLMGYNIKGNKDLTRFDYMFIDEIKTLMKESVVYDQTLNELPISVSKLLFEKSILTVRDLLLKINYIHQYEKFDNIAQEYVENFLTRKSLIVYYEDKKIYVTENFWNIYINELVIWLRNNSHSVLFLINQLKEFIDSEYSSFFDFINSNYSDFNFFKQYSYFWKMPIDELDLSVRSFNCLKRSGLYSVKDVVTFLESGEIVRNLGRKGIEEVIYKLSQLGIILNFSNEPKSFI